MRLKLSLIIGGLFISATAFCSSVDTIQIKSKSLNAISSTVIILPDSYSKNVVTRFPVVYLLHGYTGKYSNWVKKVPALKDYADKHQMIIVCPDAKNSWYLNSKTANYEDYIAKELPAYVDSAYRTLAQKEYRAITGLSMGGHGALYLAFKHPQTFGSAGSMSGVMDMVPLGGGYGIKEILTDTSAKSLSAYSNVHRITAGDTLLNLIIDCGTEDFLIEGNRNMHRRLLELKIKHDYIERPGDHSWPYWSNAVEYHLLFFRKVFERNAKT